MVSPRSSSVRLGQFCVVEMKVKSSRLAHNAAEAFPSPVWSPDAFPRVWKAVSWTLAEVFLMSGWKRRAWCCCWNAHWCAAVVWCDCHCVERTMHWLALFRLFKAIQSGFLYKRLSFFLVFLTNLTCQDAKIGHLANTQPWFQAGRGWLGVDGWGHWIAAIIFNS